MMARGIESPSVAATAGDGDKTSPEVGVSTSPETRQQNGGKIRQSNPRFYLAHLTVQNALRPGLLERQPCEVCGVE